MGGVLLGFVGVVVLGELGRGSCFYYMNDDVFCKLVMVLITMD